MKSERNKTISLSVEDGKDYLDRCISVTSVIDDIEQVKNKTVLGDTLSVLPYLPKESIDLIVADPPYNLKKDFNGNTFSKMSNKEYIEYTDMWISLVAPLLKPEASIYVCCDWKCSNEIYEVLNKYFYIQNRITWRRDKGRGAKTNWKNNMEDVWFATKSANKYTFNVDDVKVRNSVVAPYRIDGKPKDWVETPDGNYRDSYPSNFWDDLTIPFWSMPENTEHPTQKPEKLLAKLILASSNKGDLVFDPFLGSGTTSVVAKKLGRNYLGIEQNEQYCVWSELRLENAEQDKTIQGYEQGVFWERKTFKKDMLKPIKPSLFEE